MFDVEKLSKLVKKNHRRCRHISTLHLNHLYPFMGVEKAEPQEQIRGLDEDGAAGVLAPGPVDIS